MFDRQDFRRRPIKVVFKFFGSMFQITKTFNEISEELQGFANESFSVYSSNNMNGKVPKDKFLLQEKLDQVFTKDDHFREGDPDTVSDFRKNENQNFNIKVSRS